MIDVQSILAETDPQQIAAHAALAKTLTQQQFGLTISLYAPLYLANYCDNYCVYCGFHARQDISRKKLTMTEVEAECQALSAQGIQSVLLLTGESRKHTPPEYIAESARIARKYFSFVSAEIYPLEVAEYELLVVAGVDGVTLYQETYDRDLYAKLHRAGKKRDYDYRYTAPERMAQAGFRFISLGVLLGLAPWQKDIQALFTHIQELEHKYPGVEFGFGVPRIQQINNDAEYIKVTDKDMIKILTAARLLFPRAGISVSTRERPVFRDAIIGYGVTRMSAGSMTQVGGYQDNSLKDVGQFEINDARSIAEMKLMVQKAGYDPVFTEWRGL